MDSAVRLIDSIARLLGAIAWPIAVVVAVIFVLKRHRKAINSIFERIESVTLPGGTQVNIREKLHEQEQRVAELAQQIGNEPPQPNAEERLRAVEELVRRAALLGRLQTADKLIGSFRRSARTKPLTDVDIWIALDPDNIDIGEAQSDERSGKNDDDGPQGTAAPAG